MSKTAEDPDTAIELMQELARADRSASTQRGIVAAGQSDLGRKRTNNEDQFLIAELRKSMTIHSTSLPLSSQSQLYGGSRGYLLAVADGMGGHNAGQHASSLALDQMISQMLNSVHWYLQIGHEQSCEEEFEETLRGLLRKAHQDILAASRHDQSRTGMGTTLTLAHLLYPSMYVAHAGDSRCLLVRNGECRQVTKDHTMAERMIAAGQMSTEQAATSRWRNVLWNVLGGTGNSEVIAEVTHCSLEVGDWVIVCSDGLTGPVEPEEIAAECGAGHSPESVCERLIDLANERGGRDNITLIAARVDGRDRVTTKATAEVEVPLSKLLDHDDPPRQDDPPQGMDETQPIFG